MSQQRLTRNFVLQWLAQSPGLTNAEIAAGVELPQGYVSDRMRQYELRGYVRRVMVPNPRGPEFIRWFINEGTLPKKSRAAQVLARQIEEATRRQQALKEQAEKAEVVQRVCRAPDRDPGIVRAAVAAQPALAAVWRPGQ